MNTTRGHAKNKDEHTVHAVYKAKQGGGNLLYMAYLTLQCVCVGGGREAGFDGQDNTGACSRPAPSLAHP